MTLEELNETKRSLYLALLKTPRAHLTEDDIDIMAMLSEDPCIQNILDQKTKNINPDKLNWNDMGVLKYYKEGGELCGFEPNAVWDNLCKKGYLDGDLELTSKAWSFIKQYPSWDIIELYNNKTRITVKPKLS